MTHEKPVSYFYMRIVVPVVGVILLFLGGLYFLRKHELDFFDIEFTVLGIVCILMSLYVEWRLRIHRYAEYRRILGEHLTRRQIDERLAEYRRKWQREDARHGR